MQKKNDFFFAFPNESISSEAKETKKGIKNYDIQKNIVTLHAK